MSNNIQLYSDLVTDIKQLVYAARRYVATSANRELLQTHWKVGKLIIDRE